MAWLGGPVVLAYHGINRIDRERDPNRLVTAPEHLASHVQTLRRLGYRFTTAGGLLERWPDGRPRGRIAVITVDDGWLDGLTVAAPLLERLGLRATVYVGPGCSAADSIHLSRASRDACSTRRRPASCTSAWSSARTRCAIPTCARSASESWHRS